MTKSAANPPVVKLEWTRLLGFDQADPASASPAAAKLHDPRVAKLGAKPGFKSGFKIAL
jgi:hypothetical protein